VAQLGSAFGWGPKGRRFKSGRPDETYRLRKAVEVKGSGLDLEMKSVGRREELVNELRRRRSGTTEPPTPSDSPSSDDPLALLERLAQLHAAGALTDEDISASFPLVFVPGYPPPVRESHHRSRCRSWCGADGPCPPAVARALDRAVGQRRVEVVAGRCEGGWLRSGRAH
jgi:hypothetical protein